MRDFEILKCGPFVALTHHLFYENKANASIITTSTNR